MARDGFVKRNGQFCGRIGSKFSTRRIFSTSAAEGKLLSSNKAKNKLPVSNAEVINAWQYLTYSAALEMEPMVTTSPSTVPSILTF
jgi:hypothetical protein